MTKFKKAIEATRPVFAKQSDYLTLKTAVSEKGAYEQLIQTVMDVNATYRSNAALYIKRSFAFLQEEATAGSDLDVEVTLEKDLHVEVTLEDDPAVDFIPADGLDATFDQAAA